MLTAPSGSPASRLRAPLDEPLAVVPLLVPLAAPLDPLEAPEPASIWTLPVVPLEPLNGLLPEPPPVPLVAPVPARDPVPAPLTAVPELLPVTAPLLPPPLEAAPEEPPAPLVLPDPT
jgi:hypothetical protein